jgi:hypothetical protein
MVDAIIIKPPLYPESLEALLKIDIQLPLTIAILLVIISFLLGAVVSWMITARQRRRHAVSTVQPLSASAQPHNMPVPSFATRSFEQRGSSQASKPLLLPTTQFTYEEALTHSTCRNDPSVAAQTAQEESLDNERWLHLAEECVGIFDELERIAPNVDPPRQEMIRHVKYRFQEILTRCGVELISRDAGYDRRRHQLEPPDLDIPPGTPITEIVSPGFAVGRRVLRPAHVHVATTPPQTL